MKRLVTILFCLFISSYFAFSDDAPYNKTVNITIESENYIIEHHHDWNWKVKDAYIECMDKKTGATVFKVPSPALTKLFISDDEQFIVGLSYIKIDNPYHFVLLNLEGEYIIKSHARRILRIYEYMQTEETVTNYFYWFNIENPELEFIYKNNKLVGISVSNFDRNDRIRGNSNLEYNKKRIFIDIKKLNRNYVSIFLIVGNIALAIVCILLLLNISKKPRHVLYKEPKNS
jgi:hypothetical protein